VHEVRRVRRVREVRRVRRVRGVRRDRLVLKEILAKPALPAQRESMALQAPLGLKVNRVQLALRV
jgi:hypothetical protein